LILAGGSGQIPTAILVGDDRVHLEVRQNELYVRPAPKLAGLIAVRGLGIRRCAFVDEAAIALVVDLSAVDAERQPTSEALLAIIDGVTLPRIPVGKGFPALPLVLAALKTAPVTVFE
jgi:HPr kinase/phosphorylase